MHTTLRKYAIYWLCIATAQSIINKTITHDTTMTKTNTPHKKVTAECACIKHEINSINNYDMEKTHA